MQNEPSADLKLSGSENIQKITAVTAEIMTQKDLMT